MSDTVTTSYLNEDLRDLFPELESDFENETEVEINPEEEQTIPDPCCSDNRSSDEEVERYLKILQDNPDFYLELYCNDDEDAYHCGITNQQYDEIYNFYVSSEQYEYLTRYQHSIPRSSFDHSSAYTSRFNAADWFTEVQNQEIILAGLGGIGSYVSFLLSRVSPKRVILYDDDIVEGVNISGQLYTLDSIGDSKADATAKLSQKFSGYRNIISLPQRFTEQSEAGRVMICGFDSMTSRKIFYSSWKKFIETIPEDELHTCLFIDGRLAAESMQVFCFTGEDKSYMERYESEFMFSDEEAEPTACSYKQTTFCANMIGSIIVNLFINFASNLGNNLMARSLPFLTEYDAHFMEMKNEF